MMCYSYINFHDWTFNSMIEFVPFGYEFWESFISGFVSLPFARPPICYGLEAFYKYSRYAS